MIMLDKVHRQRRQPSLDQFAYTPTQAGPVIGKDRSTVYRMMNTGTLPAKKTATGRLITRETILNYLDSLPDFVPPDQNEAE
ncbi:MAG: DNA-binding protein [Mesorhizobium sp.]|nr:MAG: DNA-binding protein [Mesorhizobium sp.]